MPLTGVAKNNMEAWRAFSRSETALYVSLYLVSSFMRNNAFISTYKNVGCELKSLSLAKDATSPRISCPVSCHNKSASETVMSSSIRLLVAIRILRYALAANLVMKPKKCLRKRLPRTLPVFLTS